MTRLFFDFSRLFVRTRKVVYDVRIAKQRTPPPQHLLLAPAKSSSFCFPSVTVKVYLSYSHFLIAINQDQQLHLVQPTHRHLEFDPRLRPNETSFRHTSESRERSVTSHLVRKTWDQPTRYSVYEV
jgi:hypothetical protein